MSDVITAIVSHKSSNNKENVPPPRTPSSSKTPGDCSSSPLRLKAPRVVFAAHNRHHPYSQNLKHLPSSKMSRQPVKSILKQPSHAFLPPPSSPGTPREVTPEPEEDALSHARYFASPLAALSASLEDHDGSALIPITQHTLIQAYTKLSTRLRLQFKAGKPSPILESLLDIPLAEKLFLPNARKTTMLSMWALQHQHLPSSVLEGSAVKFVDAMDRAISGKLGKEGKKGAGCEALTAVQMQCSRYPSVFLPHISPLLRTLLEASFTNVNFRLRAPMALGGIALGILKWQQDDPTNEALVEVREDISHTVIKFFKAPVSKGLSPSNALSKAIVEGFAGADNDLDDAPDVTASPQWSLSVLTPIVVMAREELFKSPLAISCVLESLRKGVSSKNKAQVKTATRLFWCSVVWAAAIPSESGNTWDDVGIWKVARQVKASPVNVSIVCSLLYRVEGDDRAERMRKVEMAVNFVGDLVSENQQTGVYILKRLLSSSGVSSRPGSPVKPGRNPVEETDWVPDRLVATSLLDGTILNTEWRSLGPLIKDILNNGDVCAMDDVPPLTIAEIRTPEIFSILISTWEEVVSKIVFQREEEGAVAPLIVFTIWNNLLHSQVGCISGTPHMASFMISELMEYLCRFCNAMHC
ncbi:hypothetical protein FRC02_002340 [Tulasnella sp. 418]|nr:hypothetical protein FRC02_002340 [Tulasnella sp. 418]